MTFPPIPGADWFLRARNPTPDWVNILLYGADPTGTADSTAAITKATTAAVAIGAAVYIPPGTYKITSKLNWTQAGLTVIGAGSSVSSIIQATANTGVVHAGAHYQSISGLTLGYASQRASAETGSICLSLASATDFAVNSRYNDLNLIFGQTGIANDVSNTTNAIGFSSVFENIRIQHWSQSAISLVNPAGQATGCVWRNIYCSNDNSGAQASASYPVHLSGWTESVFDQLNIETATLTTHAILIDTCGSIVFNALHIEGLTLAGDLTALIDLGTGDATTVIVNGLTLFSNTFSGATKNGVVRHDVFGSSAVVNGCWMSSNTISGGGLYFIDFGSSNHCRDSLWTGGQSLSVTGIVIGGGAGTDDLFVYNNDIVSAGFGLQVAEGSNAKQGTATLNGTSAVVVSNTAVTANSRIFLTIQSPGGVTPGVPYVSARSAGTSFSLKSSVASDNSVVAYEIFEPG